MGKQFQTWYMYTYWDGNDLWPSLIDLGLDLWLWLNIKIALSSNISRTVLANNSKLGTCIPMEMTMFCTFIQLYMYIQLQTQNLELNTVHIVGTVFNYATSDDQFGRRPYLFYLFIQDFNQTINILFLQAWTYND